MRIVLLVLFLMISLYAQSLDTLLEDYQTESELSIKTKNESAGNLIIYTRDDLEKMQVETLKDILKSLRFLSYQENRLSQPDILNQDPIAYYSKTLRIYLNENELLTPISGSGMLLFGDMEMDFIDHVEIYEDMPSFDFGAEPAMVVIRLYTKSPCHDEGGRVKGMTGTNGFNKENVYYTHKEDGISYFVYANRTQDKKDTYSYNGASLKRDTTTKRFYSSLSIANTRFELHAMDMTGDSFLGSLIGNVPTTSDKKAQFINLSSNSKFLDDSLLVNFSYINNTQDYLYKYSDSAPIYLPDFTKITLFDQTIKENAFTASIKKKFQLANHEITIGTKYRDKYFNLTDIDFGIEGLTFTQPYYKERVYSLFLQDSIALNDSNMFTFSVMRQFYRHKSNISDQDLRQARIGYIFTSNKLISKTFLSHQQFAPEPYSTISPHYGNTELKADTHISLFQEFSYSLHNTKSKLVLGYGTKEDLPTLNQTTYQMENIDKKLYGESVAAEFTLFFNKKDKLELNANYTYLDSPTSSIGSTRYNYLIRMLNTIEKFDIFNEVVINQKYKDFDTFYNYSAGVKYAFHKDLHINIKGENLLNSSLEQNYLNTTFPEVTYITVPTIERRYFIAMEYLY